MRRPSAPIHVLAAEAARRDHDLSVRCPCVPVEGFDLAEPQRVVYVHRGAAEARPPGGAVAECRTTSGGGDPTALRRSVASNEAVHRP